MGTANSGNVYYWGQAAMASRVYTVRPKALLLAVLCCIFACHAQGVDGASGASMPSSNSPSMTLRGGADAAAAPQEGDAAQAESYMKEQLEYWNSLSKEQQDELLSKMSPEERANAEAFVSGKPLTMTITEESLSAWNAMSKEEQDAQLATMTPDQQDAIKAAVDGSRKTVKTSE